MMKQTPRPRSYKDERDEMIDRETNGAALDAIITGAEVLAIVCWRRKIQRGRARWHCSFSRWPENSGRWAKRMRKRRIARPEWCVAALALRSWRRADAR